MPQGSVLSMAGVFTWSRGTQVGAPLVYADPINYAVMTKPTPLPFSGTYTQQGPSGFVKVDVDMIYAEGGHVDFRVSLSTGQDPGHPCPLPPLAADHLRGGGNPSMPCSACASDALASLSGAISGGRRHGDPVEASTGDFSESTDDLSLPGRGPGLGVTRTYDSSFASEVEPPGAPLLFGPGWASSYGQFLDLTAAGSQVPAPAGSTVRWVQENSSVVTFTADGSGHWIPEPLVKATLSQSAGSFTATRLDGHQFSFATLSGQPVARLSSVRDRNGYWLNLAWSASTLSVSNHTQVGANAPVFQQLLFNLDGSGRVSSAVDPIGRTVSYGYTGGLLSSASALTGGTWQYTYDAQHRMLTLTDPNNAVTTNEYDSLGRVSRQWDPEQTAAGKPAGTATRFDYNLNDGTGTTTVTDPNGVVDLQTFQAGHLVRDEQNHGDPDADKVALWRFGYEPASGMPTSVTDPNGATTWTSYSPEGWLASRTDALGSSTLYSDFDAYGDPQTVTLPADGMGNGPSIIRYSYSDGSAPKGYPAGLLMSATVDFGGPAPLTTSYTHGSAARPEDVSEVTGPDHLPVSYTYNSAGQVASEARPPASNPEVTRYSYDLIGNRVSVTTPRGGHSVAVVDRAGSVLQTADAVSGAVADSFQRPDGSGLTQLDTGEPWSTVGTWQTVGQAPTMIAGPTGGGPGFAVVDLGSSAVSEGYGGSYVVTQSSQNLVGLVFGYKDPQDYWAVVQLPGFGTWAVYRYVGGVGTQMGLFGPCCTPGQRVSAAVAGGGVVITGDSSVGVQFAASDPSLVGTSKIGFVATSVNQAGGGFLAALPGGMGTTHWYDADGRQVEVATPSNTFAAAVTKTTYDHDGRVIKVVDGTGVASTQTYDPGGRMVERDDHIPVGAQSGAKTTYSYDGIGRVTQVTPPVGSPTTTAYHWTQFDPVAGSISQPAETVSSPGQNSSILTQVDQDGRPTHVDYGDPIVPDVTLTYDALGRRRSMHTFQDDSWSYNRLGQLVSATRGTETVGYEYDAAGRQWRLTYPGVPNSPKRVTRGFDSATGRWTSVSDWAGHTAWFGYDADGNVNGKLYSNGTGANISFDVDDQVSGVSVVNPQGALASWTYTRNAAQSLSGTTSTGYGSNDTYTYDNRYQLRSDTTAGNPSATASYAFDAAGDPTALGGVTQAFNGGGELCWRVQGTSANGCGSIPAGATTYQFNSQGARTASSGPGAQETFGVDQAGQLFSYSRSGGPSVIYTYDGDGLRLTKSLNGGGPVQYGWDDTKAVPELLQDGGDFYVYGPDGDPVERLGSDEALFLHVDQQHSVRIATRASDGSVAETAEYTPWGSATWTRRNGYTGPTPTLGYNSQYTDPETGFLYLRTRYYDPATARFLTRDPLEGLTRSPYSYVNNDPLNGSDPTGLWPGEGLVHDAGSAIHGVAHTINNQVIKPVGRAVGNGCPFGHNANGSCRGSNIGNDLHFAASTLEVAAVAAVVVAAPEMTLAIAGVEATDLSLALGGGAATIHFSDALLEASEEGCTTTSRCADNVLYGGLDALSGALGATLSSNWRWSSPLLVQALEWMSAANSSDHATC